MKQQGHRNPYTLWGMVWRVCLAVGFAMSIYAAYFDGDFTRFLWSCVFCAAMAFFSVRYCLRYHRAAAAPVQTAQAEAPTPAAASPVRSSIKEREARQREWERTHGVIETKIAGVTFNNADGSSRQAYLKEILASGASTVKLESFDFKGENDAIRVIVDGMCVGTIPANRVEEVSNIADRITAVDFRPESFVVDDDDDDRPGERLYRADLHIVYSKEEE